MKNHVVIYAICAVLFLVCVVMLVNSLSTQNVPCADLLDDPVYPTRCKIFIEMTLEATRTAP